MARSALCSVFFFVLLGCAQGDTVPFGAGGSGARDGGSPAGGGGGSGAGEVTTGAGGEGGSLPPCDEQPCKLVDPQCGCPEGQKCTINGTGARSCDEEGTVAVSNPCGAEDCVAGAICLGGAGGGYCAKFCGGDTDCPASTICGVKLSNGMGGELPNVAMCSSTCDPASASGCPAGMGCVLGQESTGAMRLFFMCFPAGAGLTGALCSSAADCAPGYGCYNDGVSDACYKNCNVNGSTCLGGETCYELTDQSGTPVNVNGYALGVCQ